MDSETLKTWIGDPEAAPADQRATALTVRAFLASDEPEAHAGDVARLPAQVAEALVAVLTVAGDAGRLGVVKAHAGDRATRKTAGKALHALRSRGLPVPQARPASPRKIAIGRPAAPPSWMTHHDYTGAALTILGEWDASYGPFFVLAVESEERGLQLSDVVRGASRKMERELIREMHLEDKGVPIEADVARALIASAVRRTRAAGRPLPEGWARVAPFVEGADQDLATPSIELAGDPLRQLFSTPPELALVIADWLPEGGAFNETALALHTAATSPLAVNDRQRAEFVANALSRHMDTWFDAGRRAAWALRFERAALLLERRGQEGPARVALAAARVLRDESRPASAHPLLRRRWEQLFDLRDLLESFREEGGEPGPIDDLERSGESLIIRP